MSKADDGAFAADPLKDHCGRVGKLLWRAHGVVTAVHDGLASGGGSVHSHEYKAALDAVADELRECQRLNDDLSTAPR